MEAKDLKKIADNHGIEYHKNANAETMQKILLENDIHVGDAPIDPQFIAPEAESATPEQAHAKAPEQPKSYTNFDHEIKDVQESFRAASSDLELKRANQKRHVLKVKIMAEKNLDALKKILTWERSRNVLSKMDEYKLNEIEKDDLEHLCECVQKIPAAGTHAQLGGVYPFKTYYDETRESEMYVIYIDRDVAPEEQIDKALAFKIQQGFMPNENDYAAPKKLWHRRVLVEREFKKYFRVKGEEELYI